jgi:hypothetical protein
VRRGAPRCRSAITTTITTAYSRCSGRPTWARPSPRLSRPPSALGARRQSADSPTCALHIAPPRALGT